MRLWVVPNGWGWLQDMPCAGGGCWARLCDLCRVVWGGPSGPCLPLPNEQLGRQRLRSCSSLVVLGFEDCSCVHCGRVLSCHVRVAEMLAIQFTSCWKDGPRHPASQLHRHSSALSRACIWLGRPTGSCGPARNSSLCSATQCTSGLPCAVSVPGLSVGNV